MKIKFLLSVHNIYYKELHLFRIFFMQNEKLVQEKKIIFYMYQQKIFVPNRSDVLKTETMFVALWIKL